MKAAEDDGRAHTGDAEQVVVVEGMAAIGSVVGRINGSASAGEEGARKKVRLRRKPINCLNALLDWHLQNSLLQNQKEVIFRGKNTRSVYLGRKKK